MGASAGGSKSKGSSSSATGFDAQTQDWINKIYQSTQAAAGSPPPGADPLTGQAGDFYSGQMSGAQRGAAALGGDADATRALSDPHTQQVIDASREGFGALQAQTQQGVNAGATLSGAFGGARHGVASGTALASNTRDQALMEAQLRSQGYQGAMDRAGQLVNFGFGGASGGQAIGDYKRNVAMEQNPALWRMRTLQQGLMGTPYGQTSKTRSKNSELGAQVLAKIPFFGK